MSLESKVYGAPLQGLYRRLQTTPGIPRQPEILRELSSLLQNEGLEYHLRTLKRQLLGDIEYVPLTLEKIFIQWLDAKLPKVSASLRAEFERAKSDLGESKDQDLYVPPEFFIEMANAYLFLHKEISRRALALKLKESLAQKNIAIGLETLQAALSGKTLKIRKILEDELLGYLSAEGFGSREEVLQLLEKSRAEGMGEVKKVDVGNLPEKVDAFLMNQPGVSRRQLAISLQKKLSEKGYRYHLSSLQSTLEGKTRKTRQAVLEAMESLFAEGGNSVLELKTEEMSPEQREWHHYISAEGLPGLVDQLLQAHPGLTRRQIALSLQGDLKGRNFKFSLNTLQYILGAKTRRVKKVVLDLLESYLSSPDFLEKLQQNAASVGTGRPSLEHRLALAYERLQSAPEAQRHYYRQVFLDTRNELIKKRWLKKHPKVHSRGRKRRNDSDYSYESVVPDESMGGSFLDPNDIPVAYDIEASSDRLVS